MLDERGHRIRMPGPGVVVEWSDGTHTTWAERQAAMRAELNATRAAAARARRLAVGLPEDADAMTYANARDAARKRAQRKAAEDARVYAAQEAEFDAECATEVTQERENTPVPLVSLDPIARRKQYKREWMAAKRRTIRAVVGQSTTVGE